MLKVPAELWPLVRVRSVRAGFDADAYLTRALAALFPGAGPGLTPIAPAAPMTAGATPADPVLETEAALREMVPGARHDHLLAGRDHLTGTLRALYPVPQDDSLVSDTLTVLAEPFGTSAAGTVIYQRTTGMGVIDFILPHLALDTATGDVRLIDMPTPAAPSPIRAAASFDGSAALSAALSVGQTLAFAIPPPWGPMVAAGVGLLEMLIPNHKEDPFKAAVDSIKDFINAQALAQVANFITSYGGWLHELQGTQDLLGTPNRPFIEQTIGQLATATSGNSPLFSNMAQMMGMAATSDDALNLLVLAESIYLSSLKMTIQLHAQLADMAHDAGDDAEFASRTDAWYGAYAAMFVHALGAEGSPGCVQQVTDLVTGRSTTRLAQIGEPKEVSSTVVLPGPDGEAIISYRHGWTYVDSGAGDDDWTHFREDTTEGDTCHTHTVQHQADVQADRDAHVKQVTADLDARFGKAAQTAKKWADSITDWSNHMPPRRPQEAPVLPEAAKWPDPAPRGSVWATYKSVHYAFAYRNDKGPSPMSQWSATVDIAGRAHPKLTMPQDPLKMATHWWVYRQFTGAGEAMSPLKLIAIVPVSDAGVYTDTGN